MAEGTSTGEPAVTLD